MKKVYVIISALSLCVAVAALWIVRRTSKRIDEYDNFVENISSFYKNSSQQQAKAPSKEVVEDEELENVDQPDIIQNDDRVEDTTKEVEDIEVPVVKFEVSEDVPDTNGKHPKMKNSLYYRVQPAPQKQGLLRMWHPKKDFYLLYKRGEQAGKEPFVYLALHESLPNEDEWDQHPLLESRTYDMPANTDDLPVLLDKEAKLLFLENGITEKKKK